MSGLVQIGKLNFRFECQSGCTACCTQPGEVFLVEEELRRIASYLEVEESEFREVYCRRDTGALRLDIPPGVHCPFLEGGGCAIHPVKPLQCRSYPFWPENVRNKSAWKRVARVCRGIGVGPVLPMKEVRKQAQACLEAFPEE